MRNHGHEGEEAFSRLGINGKCSELHAAMGLCLLPRVDEIISARRERVDLYRELLAPTGIVTWDVPDDLEWNFAYMPVVFPSRELMLDVRDDLRAASIFPRRYFFPSLTVLPYVDADSVPVAESLSERVLCLPLHEALPLEDVARVANVIRRAFDIAAK